jgi:hypothetical protein
VAVSRPIAVDEIVKQEMKRMTKYMHKKIKLQQVQEPQEADPPAGEE